MNSTTSTNASWADWHNGKDNRSIRGSRRQAGSSSPEPTHGGGPPRLILYARKSTESEDRQVQSIDDQTRLCRQAAGRDNDGSGHEPAGMIIHTITEARSAKSQGTRLGFREMVEMIERGEADGIIAWHPDRLARNAVDGGWILDLLDRGKLKHLRFVSYTFENSPEGKFMLGMIFSQSKYYVDKLSKDVRRGLESRREKGIWISRAPEGYVNNVVDKTIEADSQRFPLLRTTFEAILSGTLRPSQALDTLNNEWGYRTKRTKKSGGGPLSRTSFYDMLSNPFYFGLCVERSGRTYKGTHPPLITEAEFCRIQAILGKPEKPLLRRHNFALTGLIRCGRCGCMVTATRAKGHVYYHCTNSRKVCDRRGVREEALVEQALAQLDRVSLPPEWEELLKGIAARHVRETMGKEIATRAAQQDAIGQAQRQLQSLLGMRLRELLTDEEYKLEKESLQREIERLSWDAQSSDIAVDRTVEMAESVIEFAVWAQQKFAEGSADERRQVLEQLGSHYVLTDGNLLLELHPYLCAIADTKRDFPTFKPLETGSKSAKGSNDTTSLPLGWGSGMPIERMAVALAAVISR